MLRTRIRDYFLALVVIQCSASSCPRWLRAYWRLGLDDWLVGTVRYWGPYTQRPTLHTTLCSDSIAPLDGQSVI